MIKTVWVFLVLICVTASPGYSTIITYDPINHGTAIANEISNLAQYVKSAVAETATQLNTLNTLEEQILTVERLGDPKTLTANIPGVQNLQTLSEIFSQGEKDVQDWSAYVNPESWKMSTEQILNIYGQPVFNGFTAANGVHVGAAQSLFNFQVSNYNTEEGAKQTVDRLNQQLKTLTQQLAAATSAMQSATTEAQVSKYHSAISALDSSINSVKASLQAAEFSERLQVQQNENAQQITRATQAQQTAAEDLEAIDAGLTGLPVGQMQTPLLWNSQP